MGLRVPPFAFTEHGDIMLASVLSSERAIQANVQIVRIFIKMRGMLSSLVQKKERAIALVDQ
jgi:hypothetical protein